MWYIYSFLGIDFQLNKVHSVSYSCASIIKIHFKISEHVQELGCYPFSYPDSIFCQDSGQLIGMVGQSESDR